MSENEPLIVKYRPIAFGELIGNEQAVEALKKALSSASRPHAYLFTGPSGIGKTTTARIIGSELEADIVEIDAASNSGIDAMRTLVDFAQHMSLTGEGRRLLIIDECHALSKPAWQAILKLLEEPPEHLYLALCTTELQKVPETIITRCYHVVLRALPAPQIADLLSVIADCEGWNPHPDVFALAVQAATGQPRKGISILQAIHDQPSRDEAKRVIALVEAGEPLIALLQHLLAGKKSWAIIRTELSRMDADEFEEASIPAARYIMGAMLNEQNEGKAQSHWRLLEALVFPAETWDKKAAFVAAIGRMMWGAV